MVLVHSVAVVWKWEDKDAWYSVCKETCENDAIMLASRSVQEHNMLGSSIGYD